MEALIATGKIVGGIILTAFINKLLSAFRVRQLYLSYDDILDRHDLGEDGYTASIKIYNRGKDKEKSVEVIFPNTNSCQIISSDYPSISTSGNKVLIDRVISGQKISFNIFICARDKISDKIKPIIKSEDTNGRAFTNRGNVPPSLGPVVMGISALITVSLAFAYMIGTKNDPVMIYFKLTNPDFISQGLLPLTSRSHKLISQRRSDTDPYPIETLEPTFEKDSITLHFKITNPTTEKLYFDARTDHPDKNYYKELSAAGRLPTIKESVSAYNEIDKKYGFGENIKTTKITLEPKESKTIELTSKIIPTSTINNFNAVLSFNGTSLSGDEISDTYTFTPETSKYAEALKKHIEKVQTPKP